MLYNHIHCICIYTSISDIETIQAHLIQQYQGAINCVQVMPLDEEEGLPLPQIYGSVLVEEDLTAMKKTRRPDEATGSNMIDSVADIFYLKNKLTRRIIFKGEAGHGKTVFCLKLIDTWSREKTSASANDKLFGECTNSHHQSHTRDINQPQLTESIPATECFSNPGNSKPDSSTESKNSSKSRIARLLSSLKIFENFRKQNHSKSEKQSHGGKKRECDNPSSQQHIVVNKLDSKLKDGSELSTLEQRKMACDENDALNPDQSSKLSTVVQRQMDDDVKLQSCLSVYDMVFYVPLRHARHGTSFIVDLVINSIPECDQDTEHKIKQMLSDGSIPCLVILDGLDEWRSPDTCRVQGFPDSDGLVNCTLLCTMRPWRMVSLRLGLDSTSDKVVRILGLKSSSIETVISNVLVNFYGLKLSTTSYEEKFSRFCGKAKLPELRSLMKIPLMLTASCLVWNEEDGTSNEKIIEQEVQGDSDSHTSDWNESKCAINQATYYFMTLFYLKLEEITITRAENKHGIVKTFLVEKRQTPDMSIKVPSILLGFEPIIDFIDILKPVGRLALQDLISEEPHLVFPRNKLEREIGQSNVELALKAGVLSQTKAPGLSYQQRVSHSFYHKSIQEFIAALYMTCGDTKALSSFYTHCNTVDKVMELSNVIMFVCGLDPVVGCLLSQHVKNIVNGDFVFIKSREFTLYRSTERIQELYKIQCKWFSEMKQNLSYTHNTDHTPTLHVTDVYLKSHYRGNVGVDDARVISELVSMEDNSIVSVYLQEVGIHPVRSILQHLPGCKHLIALYIMKIRDRRDVELLAEVLPQLIQLQSVVYGYSGYIYNYSEYREKYPQADTAVVRAVQHLPALRRIELKDITLTDTVTLPLQLETVKLRVVQPSHFILPSEYQCSQLKCIKLEFITLTDTVTLSPQLQKVKLFGVDNANFILSLLPGCPHLTSLYIRCLQTMEDCKVLASVLPQLKHLQDIYYSDVLSDWCAPVDHVAVVSALQHLTQLTHIELGTIDLGDDGTLLVTPHMTQLQEVKLYEIKMSGRRWAEFFSSLQYATQLTHITLIGIDLDDAVTILVTPHMTQLQKVSLNYVTMSARKFADFVSSLLSVQHTVHVTLYDTAIDGDTLTTIHTSPHFTVTEEKRDTKNDLHTLEFHTVL